MTPALHPASIDPTPDGRGRVAASTSDGSRPQRPTAKDAGVSDRMSRMPRASTGPEMALRRALHSRGLRFRLHRRDLPGSPDIVLPRARLAIFVDGCFWHGCPDHGALPKHNREWWAAKLAANVERDRRKDAELIGLGWLPLHIWEHTSADRAAEEIQVLWRQRTAAMDRSRVPRCGALILEVAVTEGET